MKNETQCLKCNSENIYFDGSLWVCPECSNEWMPRTAEEAPPIATESNVIKDAHGNVLSNGDTVSVIKDLKVNGSSTVVKSGTKVKNIRLVDAGDGHDISCKIEGLGSMNLKSMYVKKI